MQQQRGRTPSLPRCPATARAAWATQGNCLRPILGRSDHLHPCVSEQHVICVTAYTRGRALYVCLCACIQQLDILRTMNSRTMKMFPHSIRPHPINITSFECLARWRKLRIRAWGRNARISRTRTPSMCSKRQMQNPSARQWLKCSRKERTRE